MPLSQRSQSSQSSLLCAGHTAARTQPPLRRSHCGRSPASSAPVTLRPVPSILCTGHTAARTQHPLCRSHCGPYPASSAPVTLISQYRRRLHFVFFLFLFANLKLSEKKLQSNSRQSPVTSLENLMCPCGIHWSITFFLPNNKKHKIFIGNYLLLLGQDKH